MILEQIANDIITYQEDNPHIVITDDMIKDLIKEYEEKIIEEIREMI